MTACVIAAYYILRRDCDITKWDAQHVKVEHPIKTAVKSLIIDLLLYPESDKG